MSTTWFTVKVRSMQIDDNGNAKQVATPYIVDAVSFTDAEARIYKEMNELMREGEFEIESIVKSQIADIFEQKSENGYYFKAKITYYGLDEKSGKEKKTNSFFIIEAEDMKEAMNFLEFNLSTMVVPYEIIRFEKTDIVEIYHYVSVLDIAREMEVVK